MDKVFKCNAKGKRSTPGRSAHALPKTSVKMKSNIHDNNEMLFDENTKIRETIAKG